MSEWIALSQYGFPFSIGHCFSPIGRFRALARRSRFLRHDHIMRMLAACAMTLGWPFGACLAAVRSRAWMRYRKQAPNGVRVLLDMYWLALRHSIPPFEYALYRFNEAERRKSMHEYLYWNDLVGMAALNALNGADNRDVQDKHRFAQICARNGLPHVATLAVFDGGKQTFPLVPFVSDEPTLWTKSLRLKGGAGGAKWIKDGGTYRNKEGREVAAADLPEEFCKQDCLLQPFIESHPDIARVSNEALAALRIVTGMNEMGEAEFVATHIGLPYGVCETSVAAIVGSVDPENGRIRNAVLPDGAPISSHPDTGNPIAGIMLPYWRESLDLVCSAHAGAFSCFAFLGWDVALTIDGPLLLEANSGWGAIFHQMLDGPLGNTSFSRLVSHYV
jgi:Sugar-transfer associated ATP-grasp